MPAQLLFFVTAIFLCGTPAQLLPDITVDPAAFADRSIDTITKPGRILLRFRSSIPNIGLGEFRIVSTGMDAGDGVRQSVEQRIQFADLSTAFLPLGASFLYNPATLKMDVTWWTRYYVREVLPGNGVGRVLAHGEKPNINVTSSTAYNTGLPNSPTPGNQLFGSGPVQGISVGYTDIYAKGLPLQWVDVTHLPPGNYWLEMNVDVDNTILESDDTNNSARTLISLTHMDLPPFLTHMADTDNSLSIALGELLRVIQLFNFAAYHCLANTEDGYLPGQGIDHGCLPHSADYSAQDWKINLPELLRVIQFYNVGAYAACSETEDGYCPA